MIFISWDIFLSQKNLLIHSDLNLATALLERTTLNVKVTCQAVHAKSVRRTLVDCIDFLQPNLVIVGRHGVSSVRGTLMGTVCQYLVQKSSVPVEYLLSFWKIISDCICTPKRSIWFCEITLTIFCVPILFR